MEYYVDLVFVNVEEEENSSWLERRAGDLVKQVTGSRWAHVVLRFPTSGGESIFQAAFGGVGWYDTEAVDAAKEKESFRFSLQEEEYLALLAEANSIANNPYGYDDCLIGGAHDVLRQLLPDQRTKAIVEWIRQVANNPDSYDCSAAVCKVLRAKFKNLLPGMEVETITPERLYQAVPDLLSVAEKTQSER